MGHNIVDECKVPFLLAGGNPNWVQRESHLTLVTPPKQKLPESHRSPRSHRNTFPRFNAPEPVPEETEDGFDG